MQNAVLFVVLVLIPLWISPWASDPLEIDKVIIMRAISVAAFLFFVRKEHLAWIKKCDVRDPGFWFLLFVGWSVFATIFSSNPFRSVFGSVLRGGGLVTLLCMFLLYVAFRSVGEFADKSKKNIAFSLSITAGIISVLAIVQYVTRDYFIANVMLSTTDFPHYLIRSAGTFGHPLYLGIFLSLILPFVWYAYQQSSTRFARYFNGCIGILMLVAVYFSRSRIALFSCALIILFVLFSRAEKKYRWYLLSGIIVLFVFSFLLLPSLRQTIARGQSMLIRTQEWQFASRAILHRPFFGYGFETYDAYSISRERDQREIDDGIADRVHNIFLDTAWNAGIPAVILFIVMVWCVGVYVYQQKNNLWTQTIGLSLLAYLIVMQTSFDFSFTYGFLPFLLAQCSPKPESIFIVSKQRIIVASSIFIILLFPLIAHALLFRAYEYNHKSDLGKELALYNIASIFSPATPEIDLMKSEVWYGLHVMRDDVDEIYLREAQQAIERARKKGLPWYVRAGFE